MHAAALIIKERILCRADLYYGGEGVGTEQPQSLTCPYCGRLGFTELTLMGHTTADHPDTSAEVVCCGVCGRGRERVWGTPRQTIRHQC